MDDLVLEWKKELGWQKSPFEQKILLPVEDYFAGYEKEQQKFNLLVLNEKKFGTIQGETASGKSTLLLWMKETLEKHKNKFAVVLLHEGDFKNEKKLIEALSAPFASEAAMKLFFKKLMGKAALTRKNIDGFIKENIGTRRLFILVDTTHLLAKEDYDLFSRLLKLDHCAVILASPKKEWLKEFPKDELAIDLKKMDFDGARSLLKKRIEAVGGSDIWPFSDKILKDLCGLGDYLPGKILALCQERAKELAIDVKTGRIPHPEKRGIFVQHDIKVMDKKVEQPSVEKKHSGGAFGIKFVVIDDEKPRPVKEAIETAQEPKEELAAPDPQINEQERAREKESAAPQKKEERKGSGKKKGVLAKKEEEKEGNKEEKEEKGEKEGNGRKEDKDFPVITVDLGYTDEKKKPEKKMEKKIFDIDITPVKKKK
jgi:hypothetical protein